MINSNTGGIIKEVIRMTEKRFEIKIGEFEEENIVDNLNRMTIREISDMCKKMNELHKENEQLKQLLKSINGSFTFDDNYASWFEDCVIVSKEGLKEISLRSDVE